MRHLFHGIIFLVVLFVSSNTYAKPTINDYTNLPDVAYASLSTDGRYVALTRPYEGKTAAFIYNIDNPGTPKVINNQDDSIDMGNYRWLGPEHLVFTLSKSVKDDRQVHDVKRLASFSMETGKFALLMSKGAGDIEASNYSITWVVNTLPNEPNHILMAAFAYQSHNSGLQKARSLGNRKSASGFVIKTFKVNLTTGKAKGKKSAVQNSTDILVNSEGKLIARYDYDEQRKSYSVSSRVSGKWKEIYEQNTTLREFNLQGLSAKPNTAIISRYGENGYRELAEMSLETGNIGKKVYASSKYDFDYIIKDPKTDKIVGVSYQDDYDKRTYFDNELKQWQAELKASFPGQNVILYQWNAQRTRFLIYVEGGGSAGEYHLFDTADMSLSNLGTSYPKLSKGDIAKVTQLSTMSSDGTKIPGYLTLPPGKSLQQGPFPLVVMPHGGPESRDTADFDYQAQFLASRGYAVYQPNFRGSSGYGGDFRDAGYSEFGGKMVDDVIGATKELITKNIAKPGKICIMGGSYGGYSALASSVKAPNLYACAISINGVTNIGAFYSWVVTRSGKLSETVNYWKRYIGEDNLLAKPGPQKLTRIWSPAHQAHKIKASVLLFHGNEDTNVPYAQFTVMQKALKKAGVEHQAITMKGNDHYLKTSAARHEVLSKSVAFIDKHIGN